MKIIKVNDCSDCPYYEQFIGRENVYHTCRENNRTVQKDYMILYRFCELEDIEDLE